MLMYLMDGKKLLILFLQMLFHGFLRFFPNIWSKDDIDTCISHIPTYSNKIRVSETYLRTIKLINNRKIQWDIQWDIHWDFCFFYFYRNRKIEYWWNVFSSPNCKIKYLQNVIPIAKLNTPIAKLNTRKI